MNTDFYKQSKNFSIINTTDVLDLSNEKHKGVWLSNSSTNPATDVFTCSGPLIPMIITVRVWFYDSRLGYVANNYADFMLSGPTTNLKFIIPARVARIQVVSVLTDCIMGEENIDLKVCLLS